ncbi:hypothetical protein CDD82_4958 [Ophiocordyceps australis]|uniref:DNA-directed RNA polymerase n=1 Tax=Ophiocordyceps australis TaxID=1399860 RepID=A0A2C5Z4S2_9HYPO|nr:hypothetical protein CDD82_4958 [Ophiocordyceps australis]
MVLSRQARGRLPVPRTTPTRPSLLPLKICTPLWPYRRLESDPSSFLVHERGMATAVNDYRVDSSMYNPINSPAMSPFIHSSLLVPKTNKFGVPGDVLDLLPMFDACIQVKKIQRAAEVLKRLSGLPNLSDEELIILHNRFLKASVDAMRLSTDRSNAEDLHTWRYMEMAPRHSALNVLSIAEILSDTDLAVITKLFPAYNYIKTIEDDQEVAESHNDMAPYQAVESELPEMPLDEVESEEADQILETKQRGGSLHLLKKELSIFDRLENVDISQLPESERLELQRRLERNSIEAAIAKWRVTNNQLLKMGKVSALGTSSNNRLSRLISKWFYAMEKQLVEELELVKVSEERSRSSLDRQRCLFGPLLQQSDPGRLAALTILCVINNGALAGVDRGLGVSNLVHTISARVQEDIETQKLEMAKKHRKRKHLLEYVERKQKTKPITLDESPEVEKWLDDESAPLDPSEAEQRGRWSNRARAYTGSILLKTLVETAKVDVKMRHPQTGELVTQSQPAFTHMQRPRKGKKIGTLVFNPAVTELLRSEPIGDYLAKQLPMITKPRPWTSFDKGGFFYSKTSFVRVKQGDEEQRLYTEAAIRCGNMRQIFKGLDVLGRTAWKINEPLLKVMMEAWNSGQGIANMPPLEPTVPQPPEPPTDAPPHERYRWMRALKVVENEKAGLHSQRCYMNLQLEVARAFRKQTIYFPHNVDYRGRTYPIPTYLNHMGADHTRAVLVFAERRKLGTRGLKWLKIHLANVYGLDKSSLSEREKFTDEHTQDIIESASNPLNGRRWWLKAEDPWQCLGACMELKAALDLADPTEFLSSLPIHQDGTCNGLQHYAALGGDLWGAKQVNLEPGDRPADVYSAVADLVKADIEKDAAGDNTYAKVLQGKITRKVVKQTVMTNVYGVTFVGAKKQVCKQLDDLYPDLGKEYGLPNIVLATYVAKLIFGALATMFKGAHDIQHWLGDIGSRVSRALTPTQLNQLSDAYRKGSGDDEMVLRKGKIIRASDLKSFEDLAAQFRSTIVWTTPLRMPVVQPYRKCTSREIRTCFQALSFPIHGHANMIDRRKQLQGFPPNFIHSLDASHMLLSALKCDELGLTFAAVHDSFWTHAADIDVMNAVLREAFINIHQDDVVGRLADEFRTRHDGSIYLARVETNSPAGKEIKELRKKIKRSAVEELLLEHKRLTLMRSSDPLDRETAKQIITPASIYEKAEEKSDIAAIEDAKLLSLGKISENERAGDEGQAESDEESESASGEEGLDLEAEADMDMSSEDITSDAVHMMQELLSRASTPSFESQLHGYNKKAVKPKKKPTIKVWLPLTIPKIPEKGEFDVKRLRQSQYFFS